MIVARTIEDCRSHRSKWKRVAFVPTMGALHAGHVSLIESARKQAPRSIVSIFVNPTQFGPREDFNKYPRPVQDDLARLETAGVDLAFVPSEEEMYPTPPEILVDLPQLSSVLEGRFRPNHFRGVCQVVAKLFNIVQPNAACFGLKDFQQLRIITEMVRALDWPIEIIACPTVREPDGLAMSSRNQNLSAAERQRAVSIYKGLSTAHEDFKKGGRQANRLVTTIQNILLDGGIQGRVPLLVDYVAAVDALTLKTVELVATPTVLAVAARVGVTRLIDNIILTP
jgi:pantoate--beta-alanine ligase